jgi:hypothetical protein
MRIKLSESQAIDLAAVCDLGHSALNAVALAIESSPTTIRQSVLRHIVAQTIGNDKAPALCRVIFGLSSLSARDSTKALEIVDGVSNTLKDQVPDDARFIQWVECSPELIKILQSKSVFLAAKTLDVSYDFERVLTASRVLTSIRPIFVTAHPL